MLDFGKCGGYNFPAMKRHFLSRKDILAALLVLALTGGLALGAVSGRNVSGNPEGEDEGGEEKTPEIEYTIGVVNGKSGSDDLIQGFSDALTDQFGEWAFVLNRTDTEGDAARNAAAVTNDLKAGSDLIFAIGDSALSTSATLAKDLPVVGADVMDFQTVLGIGGSDWDGKTGTNVTGISSLPDMEAVLSLLIEATPDLSTVGLLYTEGDTNALLQNHLLEAYMDEAGIAWKEYALPLSVDPEAAAAAEAAGTPLPTLESMTALAATECSVLFLPGNSALSASAATISQIALSLGKPLVAADRTAGQSALVCAYDNPYVQGYYAGELAVRILRDGYYPGDLEVLPSGTPIHKLYSRSYADILGMTFPKSFTEYSEFFTSYDMSSDIDRAKETEKLQ